MSKALRNPEVRWFAFAVLVTLSSLTAAFFLKAASQPAQASATARTPIYTPGAFTFSAPLQLGGKPISPAFYQADAEPEIKTDVYGNIYATAINGVPGGWQFYIGGFQLPFPLPWIGGAIAGGLLAIPVGLVVLRRLRTDYNCGP